MRSMKFLVLAAAFAVLSASTAQAGVYGSVLFDVTSINVQRASGTLASGPTSGFSDIGISDLTLLGSGIFTSNEAELIGLAPVANPGGPDPLQAFVTSGAEAAGAENDFTRRTPVPATSAFARADQETTGLLTDAGGLSTKMVAEIEALDLSTGSAGAGSSGISSFSFSVAQSGWFRLEYDTLVDMLVSSVGPPALRNASANTNLTIQINGLAVTLDSPGLVNADITGTDSFLATTTGTTTGAIFLASQPAPHTLTITQQATVSLAAVPEPASLLAFVGILGVSGLRRRRRQLG